jgi:hypothetical protein
VLGVLLFLPIAFSVTAHLCILEFLHIPRYQHFQFCRSIHNILKHALGSFLQFLLFLCLDHSGLHSFLYHVIPLIGPNYPRPDAKPPWPKGYPSLRRDRHRTRRKSLDAQLLDLSHVFWGCSEATAPCCSNTNLACRVGGAREKVQASLYQLTLHRN